MTLRASTHSERFLESWMRLHRGHAAVKRTVATTLQVRHGLTINDYEALALLARAEGRKMRRTDLARDLHLTASGITRLLEGLEEQGLVRKQACTTDGRVCYTELTAAGRRRLDQASAAHSEAIKALFEERYTARELAVLAELLGRLPAGVEPSG
jgi:MarR family 2-MHQ and catechol resistance regulon transcriptional repressor